MNTNFKENLKAIVENSGTTYAEIARKVGLNRKTVWAWANTPKRSPDPDNLVLLANALGVTEQELLNPQRKLIKHAPATIVIEPCEQNDILEPMIISKFLINNLDPFYLRYYRVLDKGLEPKFFLNDILILDMFFNKENKKIDGIYLVNLEGTIGIKKVEFLPKNEVILSSVNEKTKDILPERMGYNYKLLGKVCKVITAK